MQKSKKVENGKLVKIDAELGEKFEDVKVHGDFFIEPADKLEDIRGLIEGLERDFDREKFVDKIENLDAIGFSAEDIADVLEEFRGENQ
jgi:lipoate-protein ligase A